MITEQQHLEIANVGKAQVAVKAMEMVSFSDMEMSAEWLQLTLKADSLMLRAWDNTDRLLSGA